MQDAGHSRFFAHTQVALIVKGGQSDDGYFLFEVKLALEFEDPLRALNTVHYGHVQIHKNEFVKSIWAL